MLFTKFGKTVHAEASQKPDVVVEKLPFCGDDKRRETSNSLLFVTTLDGTVSALDVTDGGKLRWNVSTGSATLLSSNIHRLELTNNGKWIRMIPSLSGGLYKFDGESVEPIPVTADDLLSSSFKFTDDLVFSGGKEISSYFVSARTGQILRACTMNGGCIPNKAESGAVTQTPPTDSSADKHDDSRDDVIVVQRKMQTVRAVEPRTGEERWNFSVGLHELEVHKSKDCHDKVEDVAEQFIDLDYKVIVPEGVILAVEKNNPKVVLWKYQFDVPIVNVWKINSKSDLEKIDMFSSAQWLWDVELHMETKTGLVTPSLYVGMHQKQLYIQESQQMENARKNANRIQSEKNLPKIPWKPFPAASTALALIDYDRQSQEVAPVDCEGGDCEAETPLVTAMSVLHGSEYVNGNGFYLYSSQDSNASNTIVCPKDHIEYDEESVHTQVKVIIVSLWYWWKEITVLTITLAYVLHTLSQSFRRYNQNRSRAIILHKQKNKQLDVLIAPPSLEQLNSQFYDMMSKNSVSYSQWSGPINGHRSPSVAAGNDNISSPTFSVPAITPAAPPAVQYVSRFLTDFDMVQCLGHGGFGVVFEMKNKLDGCHYAIKRITLPNNPGSRDRVMREVKTLAHCEHQNIVRYFQSWVETPPDGWQEEEDKKWLQNISFSDDMSHLYASNENTSASVTQASKLDSLVLKYTHKSSSSDFCVEFCDSSTSVATNSRERHHSSDSVSITVDDDQPLDARSNGDLTCSSDKSDDTSHDNTSNVHHPDEEYDEDDVVSFHHSDNQVVKSKTEYKRSSKRSSGTPRNRMYLYIQMQLCQKESLKEWLKNNKFEMRKSNIISVFQQIVGAVEYVHLKGLIHRDLKPSNIFFSMDGKIKIGDFGLVTDMQDIPNIVTKCGDETGLPSCPRHTQHVGTHLYMSPEQLQGRPYDYKVDIYSLGLIFFELLCDFGTEMEHMITLKSLRKSEFPNGFADSRKDEYNLLKLMLSPQPKERPTTMGIRARPPLGHIHSTDLQWHFELPPIRENGFMF